MLLLNGPEAALFLAEAPGGLAIVENRQREAFLAMAGQLGEELLRPIRSVVSMSQRVMMC